VAVLWEAVVPWEEQDEEEKDEEREQEMGARAKAEEQKWEPEAKTGSAVVLELDEASSLGIQEKAGRGTGGGGVAHVVKALGGATGAGVGRAVGLGS